MGHIFISYSRSDTTVINSLVRPLKAAHFTVWVDRENITGGAKWRRRIVDAIESADAVLVVLSANAIESDNVRKELDIAEESKKQIIPLVIKPVSDLKELKYHLSGLQRIDLTMDFDAGVVQLLEALTRFQELVKDIEAKADPAAAHKEKILDLLKGPEPPSTSAHEIGADARDLMEWHHELMERPVMERYLWERYQGGIESWGLPEPAYGRITYAEFSRFLKTKPAPPYHLDRKKEKEIIRRLALFRKVLNTMDSKGAKVVDYMPAQLKTLPAHLTKLAIEILLDDPLARSLGRPFEITPNALSSYRSLHGSPEVKHLVDQIAQHLGWRTA